MPELPEVETVRRGLQPVMEGARIEQVELRRPDLRFPLPLDFAARLQGRTIDALARRAKYLLIHLDDGTVVIAHLGMSGSFRIEQESDPEPEPDVPGTFHYARSKDEKHDHVVFHLQRPEGCARVIYNDPRRFGFMLLAEAGALHEHPMLNGLGVEPTGNALDGLLLSDMLRDKKTPLKSALLDQHLIAGLGNIYVCEALWRAAISPKRLAGTLAGKPGKETVRTRRLAEAIRTVIADAVAAGGSTLRDHRQADGSLGYFQHTFSVYDREGSPCPRLSCTGAVQRITQAGRSTFYCPRCQR
ncbi:bifunctional DNA-formamidopyrimidine glycosylase/DNA-(apurinic or apyrimidinic site) lyase [Tianweitania sp.]|uniref:bifunctional DNA-formamidopyrimidine glycosylase/DNA-(apurinic or apyrimidinic site) lyase n=1 Tax=Tianweitania sp. TaxID=2021634 RepID=UPI0028992CD0|nr:bifunctional DNA-formamidopyrimidine glycosylase/DNA-(apurinic or apyrimidinic site) lyase [Tianweitania sp.]